MYIKSEVIFLLLVPIFILQIPKRFVTLFHLTLEFFESVPFLGPEFVFEWLFFLLFFWIDLHLLMQLHHHHFNVNLLLFHPFTLLTLLHLLSFFVFPQKFMILQQLILWFFRIHICWWWFWFFHLIFCLFFLFLILLASIEFSFKTLGLFLLIIEYSLEL